MLTDMYLAGFFDADGHAQINRTGKGNYTPCLAVTQVTTPILAEYGARFGGTVGGPYSNGPHSDKYRWWIYGFGAVKAAEELIPHAFVKRDRLLVLVEFGKTMQTGRARLSPETVARRTELFALLAQLNKRGKSKD